MRRRSWTKNYIRLQLFWGNRGTRGWTDQTACPKSACETNINPLALAKRGVKRYAIQLERLASDLPLHIKSSCSKNLVVGIQRGRDKDLDFELLQRPEQF